jgi:hypothetical protein
MLLLEFLGSLKGGIIAIAMQDDVGVKRLRALDFGQGGSSQWLLNPDAFGRIRHRPIFFYPQLSGFDIFIALAVLSAYGFFAAAGACCSMTLTTLPG